MRVLHAYNRHRGGGGAEVHCDQVVNYSRERGLDIATFERDSNSIPETLAGKIGAFASGIYPRHAVQEFRRELARFRPDIVHAHELMPLITPWIFPECFKAGVPVVNTIYDFRLTCPVYTHFRDGHICQLCVGGREYNAILHNCRGSRAESAAFATWNVVARNFKLQANYVSQFIAPSPFVKDWLSSHGLFQDRITVMSPAVPIPETPADPTRGEYVAYAGRFVPEKGVELLIEAARKTGLPVKLAGNFPRHPAIAPGDPVECVMIRGPQAVAEFYRRARMVVVPSIWFETFGLVPAEAMAHGIPIIASRIGSLQRTVADGVSGLLFEPGNVGELAEKITRLWQDDALARRLGEGGFKMARERYSPAVSFEIMLQAYARAAEYKLPLRR